jgi:hypothetical protein
MLTSLENLASRHCYYHVSNSCHVVLIIDYILKHKLFRWHCPKESKPLNKELHKANMRYELVALRFIWHSHLCGCYISPTSVYISFAYLNYILYYWDLTIVCTSTYFKKVSMEFRMLITSMTMCTVADNGPHKKNGHYLRGHIDLHVNYVTTSTPQQSPFSVARGVLTRVWLQQHTSCSHQGQTHPVGLLYRRNSYQQKTRMLSCSVKTHI